MKRLASGSLLVAAVFLGCNKNPTAPIAAGVAPAAAKPIPLVKDYESLAGPSLKKLRSVSIFSDFPVIPNFDESATSLAITGMQTKIQSYLKTKVSSRFAGLCEFYDADSKDGRPLQLTFLTIPGRCMFSTELPSNQSEAWSAVKRGDKYQIEGTISELRYDGVLGGVEASTPWHPDTVPVRQTVPVQQTGSVAERPPGSVLAPPPSPGLEIRPTRDDDPKYFADPTDVKQALSRGTPTDESIFFDLTDAKIVIAK